MLPDADVMTFAYGIPYGSTFGHRGFTHSIFFAVVISAIATALLRPRNRVVPTFVFIFICAMSHPLLDACTNGGLGIAFFSPFSNRRYFFPWRPIEVSPIGEIDTGVLESEITWVWLPFMAGAFVGALRMRLWPASDSSSRS